MQNGGYLTRSKIGEFRDRDFLDLAVPEWDGTVRLRRLNVRDRIALAESGKAGESELMFMVKLVAYSVCDQAGQRVYSDAEIEELLAMPYEPLERIFKAALEFSRLTQSAAEQVEKNSGTQPGTSSDSPAA